MRRATLLLLALPLLAGCSQVAALAPVGGDDVAQVRFAAIDVLVAEGIDILDAPVCTLDGDAITCAGSTVDGEDITVLSSSADDATITVKVGTDTLYEGSLNELIEKFVRGES